MGAITSTPEQGAAEAARLDTLDRYDLRPGRAEPVFDGIARAAALVFDAPMAFVSIVGRDRIWFKASCGSAETETGRDGAFCASTILGDEVMVVADAVADPRFAANPMVTGPLRVRFYAGAPIRTPEGHRVGSLCVFDTRVRVISERERDTLCILADQTAAHIATRRHGVEMRHQRALLELASTDLSEREPAVRRIVETASRALGVERVGLWFFDETRTAIVVEDLYVTDGNRHESGARLLATEYPRYFAALAESRAIAAHDARMDPRTSEFTASYLDPLEVRSMLDVPVRSEGRVVGVLCNEQVGRMRTWTSDDEEFAGSLADLVGTVIEASRRRRTEAELRELTATLEQRVAERTTDLEASNRALVEAVNDLEAFCYSVSHDLRAPLRVINGFATMIHDAAAVAADGELRQAIARILDNTNGMSELLDDLLAFFRLGRRPLEIVRVDMNQLLRETMASLDLATDATEFSCAELEAIDADRALIGDVLGNLLMNAFKFSARRPAPRVEVGCETADGEVVYYVRDNGVGFHLDHATRLFEPFQRLHAADGYPGTGVGLAIVRRIVDRHGGRVWAESSPSRGSTFRFALPRTAGRVV